MAFENTIQNIMQAKPGKSQPKSGESIACALCGKVYPSAQETRPFCSQRCQQMDLANWMDERYGLPWENDEVDEEEFRDG